ncbi:MAG: hypothetical protein NVSMB53_12040 [Gemmatimonadaceae bacterium]
MSTDCCYVRVSQVNGPLVVLHCLTGFGGGLDDLFTERSFALTVLLDAVERLDDVDYQTKGAPKEEAERMLSLAAKARKLGNSSALHRALPDPQPSEEGWHREHAPRFIRRTRLLTRYNDVGCAALQVIANEINALPQVWPFMRAAWKRLHSFELEVEVTDPKYVAHLVVGIEFGTTAYDAWIESTDEGADTPEPDRREQEIEEAIRRQFDALMGALLAKGLIELKAGKRAALIKQLMRVDADDELSLCRKIVHVLSSSKAVEELYGTDEQLFAEVRNAVIQT